MGFHFGLRFVVHKQIVLRLGRGITLGQVGVGYFPLKIVLRQVRNLDLPGVTRISCDELMVSMPTWALLTEKKPLDIIAINPKLKLNDNLVKNLEQRSQPTESSPFYLRRLIVEKGNLAWRDLSSGIEILVDSFVVESLTKQGAGALKVTLPHTQLALPISGEKIRLLGQLGLEVKHMPNTLSIRNIEWHGNDLNLIGSGRYVVSDGSFVLRTSIQIQTQPFLQPIIDEFAPQALAYGDLLVRKGPQGPVMAQASLKAGHFLLRNQSFDHLTSHITWDNQSGEIHAVCQFLDGSSSSTVDVLSRSNEVAIGIKNVSAAKISKIITIDEMAPLTGQVVGAQFTVQGSHISGRALLESNQEKGNGFNLAGAVDFSYETKSEETRFSCNNGASELGPFVITGHITPSQTQSYQIDVGVIVDDLVMADFYSRHYLDLDLQRWRLTTGTGRLEVHLVEKNGRMESQSDFRLDELSSSGLPLKNFSGRVTSLGHRAQGRFKLEDESLKGEVAFHSDANETVIDFQPTEGRIETALKLLDLDLDLVGQGSGSFRFRQDKRKKGQPEITGTYSAQSCRFSGYPFEEVSGRLWSDVDRVRLDELVYRFYRGEGKADLMVDYQAQRYRIEGSIVGIDSQAMHAEFSGNGSCYFTGEGAFLNDPIKIEAHFPILAFYDDRPFSLDVEAALSTDFNDFSLEAKGNGRRGDLPMPLDLTLKRQDGHYSGKFISELSDLNMLIPWKENQGNLKLNLSIGTDSHGGLDFQGVAHFNGKRLTFPGFAHTVDNFDGFLTINNGLLILQSFQGSVGGGDIKAHGSMAVSDKSLKALDLSIQGQGMTLFPMDRTRVTLDSDLTLKFINGRYLLSGQIVFQDTVWEREMLEGISFNTEADFSSAESAFLDRLSYDLKLVNRGDVRLKNSLMEAVGSFNLKLGGDFDRPLITGVLEAREGVFLFGDKRFQLSKAKAMFNNPFVMNPIIQLDCETFIQNYRLRMTVNGALSRLNPQISSSPPMPQQDILALITQGEMFRRPVSTDLSARRGTAGLVSDFVLEDVKKRAKTLFGIDILRLEPDTERGLDEWESRVTIGTSIMRNMVIVYSTNMSTSNSSILYVHYQLTPGISLVAMRSEEGYYSLDIRYRKRY